MNTVTHRLSAEADLDAVFAIYMHESVNPYLGYDAMPRELFAPIFSELVAYLGTLAVAPQAQGRGVATQMLRAAMDRCRVAGISRVELMVEPDNPRAIALYERLGFHYEGKMRQACKRAQDNALSDELFYAALL